MSNAAIKIIIFSCLLLPPLIAPLYSILKRLLRLNQFFSSQSAQNQQIIVHFLTKLVVCTGGFAVLLLTTIAILKDVFTHGIPTLFTFNKNDSRFSIVPIIPFFVYETIVINLPLTVFLFEYFILFLYVMNVTGVHFNNLGDTAFSLNAIVIAMQIVYIGGMAMSTLNLLKVLPNGIVKARIQYVVSMVMIMMGTVIFCVEVVWIVKAWHHVTAGIMIYTVVALTFVIMGEFVFAWMAFQEARGSSEELAKMREESDLSSTRENLEQGLKYPVDDNGDCS